MFKSKNYNQTYHSAKLQIKNKIKTEKQREFKNTSANKKWNIILKDKKYIPDLRVVMEVCLQ